MDKLVRVGAFLMGCAGAWAFYLVLKAYPFDLGYAILATIIFIVGMLTAGRGE